MIFTSFIYEQIPAKLCFKYQNHEKSKQFVYFARVFLRFNFSLFISISELEKMVAIIVVAFMILKILLSLFADIIKYLKRAQSNINFMLNGLLEPGVFFLQIYFSFF